MAVATNITVTESGGPGFITAWPAQHLRGRWCRTSTARRAGQTIPNAAIVPLGLDQLSLFTQSGAHLIVDINGWFTTPDRAMRDEPSHAAHLSSHSRHTRAR